MREQCALHPEQLRRRWDPGRFDYRTTEDIQPLDGLVGQDRAVAALRFGLSIDRPGYNIYVAGPAGTGKTSYTRSLVTEHAARKAAPVDWVYVHNFDQPDEPLAISLPTGAGPVFAADVERLVAEARHASEQALKSKETQTRREELVSRFRDEIAQVMEQVEGVAEQMGFGLTETEQGLMPVPMQDGEPMTQERYGELSADERRETAERAKAVQAAIAQARRLTRDLERQLSANLRELEMAAVRGAVAPAVSEVRERYQEQRRVVDWLDRVEQELVVRAIAEHSSAGTGEEGAAAHQNRQALGLQRRRRDPYAPFQVNVFVHHTEQRGAPVVIEINPTYTNLFGKAEFVAASEEARADGVMHIKSGAIHRANGGYLILQAADVLRSPHAWEALQRALTTGEARIEVPGQENRILPVDTVRPEPIPLDLKVILIGSVGIYRTLYEHDEGFRKQFKLKAEFDISMEASEENVDGYARFVSQVCRREGLKHFTAEAVAQVIEHSHRLAEDQTKLSARFNEVVEVIYEASAWAETLGAVCVEGEHVRRAIWEKAERSALPERRLQELIRRGTILVDLRGAVVGQVNGLTVLHLGDYRFGLPSRITARVHMGRRGILHIEREIAMSGQIHDKGVFTLAAYLGDRFAQTRPLTFSASIAFEQNYMPVDGDSASSAELYALLSALAGVPIDQGIAVTGSVNQRGQVQPIGGVNEKVEGYFRICQQQGLTGQQGVILPRRNAANLMLSPDVVEAVAQGRFHIWAVDRIEEGIEILTGMPAGEPAADGTYPQGTLFALVDRRIEEFARRMRVWQHPENPEEE